MGGLYFLSSFSALLGVIPSALNTEIMWIALGMKEGIILQFHNWKTNMCAKCHILVNKNRFVCINTKEIECFNYINTLGTKSVKFFINRAFLGQHVKFNFYKWILSKCTILFFFIWFWSLKHSILHKCCFDLWIYFSRQARPAHKMNNNFKENIYIIMHTDGW